MSIRRFEDIESWQMARELSRQVYDVARDSGLGRDFSLKDQMLRSAGSIMDNIAEGFDAGSNREFVKFLQYSKRSCTELQSQLYRCLDQEYLTNVRFQQLYELAATPRTRLVLSSSI
ncbi:MAG: four helix bundle protein [Prosthecobacter sp.]